MKGKAALLFGAVTMAMSATGCGSRIVPKPTLESLELVVQQSKPFDLGTSFMQDATLYVKGYYSDGESRIMSFSDLEVVYISTSTHVAFDISVPFPGVGAYFLRARYERLSSPFFDFTVRNLY